VVNKDLLFMLLERINHWHDHQCIGDIFLDQVSKSDDHECNSLVLPPYGACQVVVVLLFREECNYTIRTGH